MVHIQAGVFLAIFCMAELSIFVDESGHFDMHSKVSPYSLTSHEKDTQIGKEAI